MLRGIERGDIVGGDEDREDFVTRLGDLAQATQTAIYAWALMDNHAHILLRSGSQGLSLFMRRFLTGYAVSFNRRHRRYGNLFQNRYKRNCAGQAPRAGGRRSDPVAGRLVGGQGAAAPRVCAKG
jgi:REP element-mobilizing transposase RayT